MAEPFDKDKRVDLFQRILITFFFSETLNHKERRKVIWIVRFAVLAAAMVLAMVITLVTEQILHFFWIIIGFVILFGITGIARMLGKRRRKQQNVN